MIAVANQYSRSVIFPRSTALWFRLWLTEHWGLLFGCSSAFPWNGGKLPGLAVYKEVGVQRTPSFDNLKLCWIMLDSKILKSCFDSAWQVGKVCTTMIRFFSIWNQIAERNCSIDPIDLWNCELWHAVIVILMPKLILVFRCLRCHRLGGNLSATLQELRGP